MEFLSISGFEDYIKFKGYSIINPSPYPEEFIQRLRAYKIDVIFDEEDGSFQYYSQIFTDIEFPFAALTDLTGN
jgi:hypothetical protein